TLPEQDGASRERERLEERRQRLEQRRHGRNLVGLVRRRGAHDPSSRRRAEPNNPPRMEGTLPRRVLAAVRSTTARRAGIPRSNRAWKWTALPAAVPSTRHSPSKSLKSPWICRNDIV